MMPREIIKEQNKQWLNERNLQLYARYLQGARMMLATLIDKGVISWETGKDKAVYNRVLNELILSDIDNTRKFLECCEIRYVDHKRNDKGKLISCRAVFVKKVITKKYKCINNHKIIS